MTVLMGVTPFGTILYMGHTILKNIMEEIVTKMVTVINIINIPFTMVVKITKILTVMLLIMIMFMMFHTKILKLKETK